jgi:predicted GNAT family acetyltransferase
VEVTNDAEHKRYEVRVDGHVAILDYRVEEGRLVLVHTEVPDELGGQGIGGKLVAAAVADAAARGLIVVPLCPFARRWLADHPDEAAAVRVEHWT